MNTVFTTQKHHFRHNHAISQLPLQEGSCAHRAYLLKRPTAVRTVFFHIGPALIAATAWLADFLKFQKQREHDLLLGVWVSWGLQAFLLLSKHSLVLPLWSFTPVSLHLLPLIPLMPDEAIQIQGLSFLQVFHGRCINYFQHTVFCAEREQTLTKLTFVPANSPSLTILLRLFTHCASRGCLRSQRYTEHPG